MTKINVNGMIVTQESNLYRVILPNWTPIAEVIVPIDDRRDLDFDLMYNITELLSKQQGLSAVNLKELKRLRIPENMVIWRGSGEYKIYLGKDMMTGMQIGYMQMDNDLVTNQIMIALGILLKKRWTGFIQQQTVINELRHSDLKKIV